MAIDITKGSHAVAFPSKLLAQNGGKHIYNVKLSTAADNGCIIARGDWEDFDRYAEAAPTSFAAIVQEQASNGNWYVEVVTPSDALLVYQVPISPYSTKEFRDDSLFYNAAGDTVRAYELAVGDIFEVSDAAFSATGATPKVGSTISSIASKKMVAVDPQ